MNELTRRARILTRAGDAVSAAKLVRMLAESAVAGDRPQPPASAAVPVRVVQGDRLVWLRPRSRDLTAFAQLADGRHLPPPRLGGPFRHIAVLGAATGLELADLGDAYPEARLLGVEADPDNAALARRNTEHLGRRATIVEQAVWHRDERFRSEWQRAGWGPLREGGPEPRNGTGKTVDAVDAGALLRGWTGGEPVDFLLVAVESAWHGMLGHGDWTRRVRGITVDVGADDREAAEAVPLLEKLGYQATWMTGPDGGFAIGVS
jgi:hypothetical protein